MRLLIKVAPIYIFILAVECSDGEFYELVAGKVSPPAATTDQPGIKQSTIQPACLAFIPNRYLKIGLREHPYLSAEGALFTFESFPPNFFPKKSSPINFLKKGI